MNRGLLHTANAPRFARWHAAKSFAFAAIVAAIAAFSARDAGAQMTGPPGGAPAVPIALPPVNLGASGIMDALSFPGNLLVVQEIGVLYHANKFHTGDQQVPGRNTLSTAASQTQIIYQPPFTLLGGHVAANLLVGFAVLNADTEIPLTVSGDVLSDLIIGPVWQWQDLRLFGNPFYMRLATDFFMPVGNYDRRFSINPGSNLFSINPYWAFTYFFSEDRKVELSVRTHYLWNSKNEDPPDIQIPPNPSNPTGQTLHFSSTQPGQAVHWNWALSYELFPNFRAGVNGYYLKQFTDDKLEGRSQPNSREQILGIGPGLSLRHGGFLIFLSGFLETAARDRPSGYQVILRFLTFQPFGAPPPGMGPPPGAPGGPAPGAPEGPRPGVSVGPAAGAPPPAPSIPPPAPLGKVVVTQEQLVALEPIRFESSSAVLRPDSSPVLQQIVRILKERPTVRLRIEGHTDIKETPGQDWSLSAKRALAVVSYLTQQGIDPARLEGIGLGASRPVAPSKNPDGTDNVQGQKANRRTEFHIVQ